MENQPKTWTEGLKLLGEKHGDTVEILNFLLDQPEVPAKYKPVLLQMMKHVSDISRLWVNNFSEL